MSNAKTEHAVTALLQARAFDAQAQRARRDAGILMRGLAPAELRDVARAAGCDLTTIELLRNAAR